LKYWEKVIDEAFETQAGLVFENKIFEKL